MSIQILGGRIHKQSVCYARMNELYLKLTIAVDMWNN